MSLTIVEYIREDGSNPYREWFIPLDPQAAAKVATAIMRLGLGNTSSLKRIGTIVEYRIDWGPGIASTWQRTARCGSCWAGVRSGDSGRM